MSRSQFSPWRIPVKGSHHEKGPNGPIKADREGFELVTGNREPDFESGGSPRSATCPEGGNVDCDDSRSVRQFLAAPPVAALASSTARWIRSLYSDFHLDVLRRIHGLTQSTGSASESSTGSGGATTLGQNSRARRPAQEHKNNCKKTIASWQQPMFFTSLVDGFG